MGVARAEVGMLVRISDAVLGYSAMVRTTVVLECEESFRGTLHEVIRDGLAVAVQRRAGNVAFRVEPVSIGLRPGLSYDSISQFLELGEGEGAR